MPPDPDRYYNERADEYERAYDKRERQGSKVRNEIVSAGGLNPEVHELQYSSYATYRTI